MNKLSGIGFGLLGAIAISEGVIAHGVTIKVQVSPQVEVEALHDDGQPIRQAQIQIFGPTNPDMAKFSGQTDDQGRYQFSPAESGLWEVIVRQAGHGESLTLPINLDDEKPQTLASPEGTTLTQRLLTLGSVIWGCVGTALYFKRRSA